MLTLPDGRRDRGLDRRQRPPGRVRPTRRRGRGRVRVRGQPRLRRRRAARADQLPELRQPREAARRLAADRGGRRAGRGLRGARRAGRRRQRLALQRGAERPDLPDAGRRHGRPAARRRARRPARLRRRGRRDRARRRVRALARRAPSWRSCAARRRRARCPALDGAALACHARAGARAVRSGALHSAHDIAEGGARGGARRVLHRRRDRRHGRARRTAVEPAVRRGAGPCVHRLRPARTALRAACR